jgi:hypothetical protein
MKLRCGVLAGGGQFGRPDQGIFSYWINAWFRNCHLKYIGFDGKGHQVRDCLHPCGLVPILRQQMDAPSMEYRKDEDSDQRQLSVGQIASRTMRSIAPATCPLSHRRQDADSILVGWRILGTGTGGERMALAGRDSLGKNPRGDTEHAEKIANWLKL